MEAIENVLLIVLGGLLATLSPAAVDAIARRRRGAQILAILATELNELRFLITSVFLLVKSKLHTMDQAAIDLIKPIFLTYEGDPDDVELLDASKQLLAEGDAAFIAIHNTTPSSGVWPLPYDAPVLQGHIGDLALLPISTQRSLLRVLRELHLFNEQVGVVQKATDRTFDSSLSPENYAANDANLASGTAKLATRASELIRAINRFFEP